MEKILPSACVSGPMENILQPMGVDVPKSLHGAAGHTTEIDIPIPGNKSMKPWCIAEVTVIIAKGI